MEQIEKEQIENLIAYFCEYELYNNLLSNSLSDKNAKDVILKNCSFDFVSKKMQERKCEKIWLSLKSKLIAKNSKDDKANINNYVKGTISLDELFDQLSFNGCKFFNESKINVDKICSDQHFCVYYPVILNKKTQKQQPLLSFFCHLLADSFIINKTYANKEAFTLLIAQHNEIELIDARSIYVNQLDELASAIDALNETNDFEEIYRVVCCEFDRIFKTSPDNFKNTNEWQGLEKAIVSFESLDNIVDSCFRDEMNCLMRFYNEDDIIPQTVKQYLGTSQNSATNINEIKESHSHVGSYQIKFPVNKKQWKLVQLSTTANLLCVEGPPGTGKTTLLKEIIADTMVKKADKLIEIWDNEWVNLGGDCKNINQSPMGGDNLNSIVISSTNGKAVDNIGIELLNEISYFSNLAKNVKVTKNDESCCEGIFCARLGNRDNVGYFYNAFFKPFCEHLNSYEITNDEINIVKSNYIELREKFNTINDSVSKLLSSREQVQEFSCTSDINIELSQLETEHQRLIDFRLQTENKQLEHENEFVKASNSIACFVQEMQQQNQILKSIEAEQYTLYSDLNEYEHISKIKRFFRFLMPKVDMLLKKYGSVEQIRNIIHDDKEKIQTCQACINEVSQAQINAKNQLKNTEKEITELSKVLNETDNKLSIISLKKSLLTDYLNRIIILGEQLNCSEDIVIGLNAYDLNNRTTIMTLRHEIFIAANRLTEVYIYHNKVPIYNNLKLILEQVNYDGGSSLMWCKTLYNGDKAYESSKATLVRTLWETFFLCFPVITTTLHSLQRNTFQLIPNLFDKLIIDESGQVIPYYVIAPLYRARSAIFVGDVNQIEPIKNVPSGLLSEKYIEILGKATYGNFCIDSTSAQSFAVLASDYYEYTEKQKSGVVLNEHIRCEPAIMSFSRQYIYHSELDIKEKDDHNKLFGKNLLAFDIRGNKASQHYNLAEIDACKNIVDLYVQEYGEAIKERIGIITPFKQQATKIQQEIPDVETGTVHIFQGAEKEYIIFSGVIDDTSVTGGLARFVGAKGNLLNVAFSRAKKQFIYIGNLQAAKNANNYLSFAVETIKSHEGIFSLFDANNYEMKLDTNIINVLSGNKTIYEKDDIYSYLQTTIPHNIINTPKLHNEILINMLKLSTKSVHIISPWIGGNVVNKSMIDIIKEQIKQEVSINIVFGYKATLCSLNDIDGLVAEEIPWAKEISANAIKDLKNLLDDKLKYAPPSHIKLLLADDKYLFIGSLNWLFNSGETKQKEISCLITNPDTINYVKNTFL